MRTLMLVAIAATVPGCAWLTAADEAAFYDRDGDGVPWPDDCDDADASVEGPVPWHLDNDGDGFGSDRVEIGCEPPNAYWVRIDGDCDDTDEAVHPDAQEFCNGIDDDCDGLVDRDDPDASDDLPWYMDADGDGHGDPEFTTTSCERPGDGWVLVGDDCDDAEPRNFPGNVEICDDVDNDCDGLVDRDDPDASDTTVWYRDADSDGFGDPGTTVSSCEETPGFTLTGGDCNDANAAIHPDADELCNGYDDDCDELVDGDDPDNSDDRVWYRDADSDGYGSATDTTTDCVQPAGYGSDTSDCDDTDDAIHPGADEVCDGEDNDCDGDIDDDDDDLVGGDTWYTDGDGDGFGDPDSAHAACTPGSTDVDNGDDCDDTDAEIRPWAPEWVDGVDGNCDGEVDGCGETWHRVPGDFDTIQEGIDGVCEFDHVWVDEGTFYESITVDRYVYVFGQGPGLTIIDAGGSARGAYMTDGALKHLTITGGYAGEGGGVLYEGAERGWVYDVEITGNTATNHGGGLKLLGSSGVIVEYSWIHDNDALEGGGIAVYSHNGDDVLRVFDTVVEANTADYGAGLWFNAVQGYRVDIEQVTVADNVGAIEAGGHRQMGSYDVDLTDVWFEGNEAADFGALTMWAGGGSWSGVTFVDSRSTAVDGWGAVAVWGVQDGYQLDVDRLIIARSQAGDGPALFVESDIPGEIGLTNVEVVGNDVTAGVMVHGQATIDGLVVGGNEGLGVYLYNNATDVPSVEATNWTVVGNAGSGIAVQAPDDDQYSFTNVISAYNGDYGIEDWTGGAAFAVRYGDLYGNGLGPAGFFTDPTGSSGNVAVDPGFVSFGVFEPSHWDLHLRGSSSLVDGGDPTIAEADGSTSDVGGFGGASADLAYYDDVDGDGMYDGWELRFGLDPGTDDTAGDLDSDGEVNGDEFVVGTRPDAADTDEDGVDDPFDLDPLDETVY